MQTQIVPTPKPVQPQIHYVLVRGIPVFQNHGESNKDFRERIIEERRAK